MFTVLDFDLLLQLPAVCSISGVHVEGVASVVCRFGHE